MYKTYMYEVKVTGIKTQKDVTLVSNTLNGVFRVPIGKQPRVWKEEGSPSWMLLHSSVIEEDSWYNVCEVARTSVWAALGYYVSISYKRTELPNYAGEELGTSTEEHYEYYLSKRSKPPMVEETK